MVIFLGLGSCVAPSSVVNYPVDISRDAPQHDEFQGYATALCWRNAGADAVRAYESGDDRLLAINGGWGNQVPCASRPDSQKSLRVIYHHFCTITGDQMLVIKAAKDYAGRYNRKMLRLINTGQANQDRKGEIK